MLDITLHKDKKSYKNASDFIFIEGVSKAELDKQKKNKGDKPVTDTFLNVDNEFDIRTDKKNKNGSKGSDIIFSLNPMRLESFDEPSSSRQKCFARYGVLKKYMKVGGVGAEIGVFKGAFIAWMMLNKPSKLYLVDPWFRSGAKWEWAKGDQSTIRAFVNILQEFKYEIEHGVIEPRLEFSQEFFRLIPDNHLDWIYIDSTHGYNQTKLEIEFSLLKVKATGFIMGDDYTSDKEHPHYGVYRAVKEFEKDQKIKLLVDGYSRQFVAQRTF
jgi:hypothetical protein